MKTLPAIWLTSMGFEGYPPYACLLKNILNKFPMSYRFRSHYDIIVKVLLKV